MLNDLEELDHRLATINISSFVVASYLRLSVLENQTRDVQVTMQPCPMLEKQRFSNDMLVFVTDDGCRKHFSLSAAEQTRRATQSVELRPLCLAAAGKSTFIKFNFVPEA